MPNCPPRTVAYNLAYIRAVPFATDRKAVAHMAAKAKKNWKSNEVIGADRNGLILSDRRIIGWTAAVNTRYTVRDREKVLAALRNAWTQKVDLRPQIAQISQAIKAA